MKYWFVLLLLPLGLGCYSSKKVVRYQQVQTVNETVGRTINIKTTGLGIPSYEASVFNYKRDGRSVLQVDLRQPVVVSVASKPEKWGYFQFPSIVRNRDHSIQVSWNLNDDAMEAYGSHKFGSALSSDGGLTWQVTDRKETEAGLELNGGERIAVHTPKPIKASELSLPPMVCKGIGDTYSKAIYEFYRLQDLPDTINGVYIKRLAKGSNDWKIERATLTDPVAARYVLRGLFPVVWWGDMRKAPDQSLISGIYPGFEIGALHSVDARCGVYFYRSTDYGRSWSIQGRIPYIADTIRDPDGNKRMGFMEPTYEILQDGSFICVMRTTDGIGNGPLYITHTKDLGRTWSTPEIVTSSGVLPHLLQLKNGITVLVCGRPGVQLRFSNDGHGKQWTDAFEMLPHANYTSQIAKWESCGYTGLLATGPDRFLIVYSDFKYPNEEGEPRKAIKVREVIVTPNK